MDYEKEISFGAFDSELMRQEIFIPEGFTATIDGNKIILKKKESEDEMIRKEIISYLHNEKNVKRYISDIEFDKWITWLEKQGKVVNEICKENDDSLTNEDEKIRKALIEYFNEQCDMSDWNGVYGYQVVTWLEKQGEHKKFRDSIQVGDEVTRNRDGVIVNLSQLNRVAKKDKKQNETFTKRDVDNAFVEGMAFAKNELEKQGEQKPTDEDMKEALRMEYEKGRADAFAQMQQEWSKEDESIALGIEQIVNCASLLNIAPDKLDKVRDWLKSLKDRYAWKPSDAQIRALEYIINNAHNTSYSCKIAKELLEQLKKLKREEV